jgi:tryptophanyl-tRNA synthetase
MSGEKLTVFTGIQPTGRMHLGNYFGSVQNISKYSHQKVIIFLADLHSFTTNSSVSKDAGLKILSYYYEACPDALFFIQSECAEIILKMYWFLCCHTTIGKLEQMTQYKDKRGKNGNFFGLLAYPILQAADILSCEADLVPVGLDQSQHLEFTRDLVRSINNKYKKEIFPTPRTVISDGSRIMDLRHPEKKMSKSNPPSGTIFCDDSKEEVERKIRRSKTDSGKMPNYYEKSRLGINNLIEIYSLVKKTPTEQVYKTFGGKNISEFKNILTEELVIFLEKIRPKTSPEQMKVLLNQQQPIIQSIMNQSIKKMNESIYV